MVAGQSETVLLEMSEPEVQKVELIGQLPDSVVIRLLVVGRGIVLMEMLRVFGFLV